MFPIYLTEVEKRRVWEKSEKVEGYDPDIWRKDFAGAWIRKSDFNLYTKYGWCVWYLKPFSKGGTHNPDNFYVMHWNNAEYKDDDYPEFNTCVTSEGNRNIEKKMRWKITDEDDVKL